MPSPLLSRPPPFFVGDHLALDFLNTAALPPEKRIEWLRHGEDLLDWLQAAGVIDQRVAAPFRAGDGASSALDAVAEEARTLREWLRRFAQRRAGQTLPAEALRQLEPLNRLLAGGDSYRQVEAMPDRKPDDTESAFRWRLERRWTNAEQFLQPIAEAIGDLICHADFRLIRACQGSNCTLVFYDRTKAHRRRWCSMAACGNRAKAATHRARRRQSLAW
jgi:predicted RNA-binding Zn ribbon-like protein